MPAQSNPRLSQKGEVIGNIECLSRINFKADSWPVIYHRPLLQNKEISYPSQHKEICYLSHQPQRGETVTKLDLRSSEDQDDCFHLVNERARANEVVNEVYSTTVASICG